MASALTEPEPQPTMEELRSPVRLLAVDDDKQTLDLIREAIDQDGLEIIGIDDPVQGIEIFNEKHPDIVLLDLMMPGMSGLEVLQKMLALDPGVEIILMTGHYSPETAVEAIRSGAADYLTKPLDLKTLRRRITELIAEQNRKRRTMRLDHELVEAFHFAGMVGRSPLMMEVFATIKRVAPHFKTALVFGDTGTGKELVASALHKLSPVSSLVYAVCNCSALVETLFESELFGYVKGAFTGATQDKVGLFEYAQGGTVFLDEIGDMPLAAQAKLLRVLQNQEVQRVGSPALRKIDVRVIAATNRDLRAMVQQQKFRSDLYYRLSMVEITLPSLSARKEDLPLLQRYFVEKFAAQYKKPINGITRRAQVLLSKYDWPGNIRELENVIGNACMMVEGSVIDAKDLPSHIRSATGLSVPQQQSGTIESLEEVQRRHVLYVLDKVGGDKTRAAEVLGIGRATLYNMLGRMQSAPKPK